MPHYFIDTDDGDSVARDDAGYVLPHANAAREMAISALPDMAREKIQDGDGRTFVVMVRGARGETIYRATLTLKGEWCARRDEASGFQPW